MKPGDIVKKDRKARFHYYRDGDLWYGIVIDGDCGQCGCPENVFLFPVPITETGTGIFEREMKSVHLLKWVTKHLKTMEKWNDNKTAGVIDAIETSC